MITAKEALEVSKKTEDGNNLFEFELESVYKNIDAACREGRYNIFYIYKEYDKSKKEELTQLFWRVGNVLRNQGYKVIWNPKTGNFKIRWDGKDWSMGEKI